MTRLLPLLFALVSGPLLAFELDDLQRQLNATAALEGRFDQQRYLADLDSRLDSDGRFRYERGARVVWTLENPVQDRLVLTPDSADALEGSKGGSRGRDQVAALLLRLLGGDWQALEARFAIALEGNAEAWRVTLTPKAEALKERIRRIELDGGRYLDHLKLLAANGDWLEVRFFDRRPLGDSAPDAAEADDATGD